MRIPFNRALAGALLLPLLLGTLVLWSLADRAERSDRVPTAVVNLDEPVFRDGQQPVYAGRLLAGELTSPREESANALGWELTDAEDANAGLADGDYYAVLTIPRDFSRTLAGLGGQDPRTAGITVRSNDSSSALVGQISAQVGDIATNRLGHMVTATYVEGVLSQSGVLKERLGEAAAGASRLQSGAHQLGDGADELSAGAGQLADGAGRLQGGIGRLGDGAGDLAGGADQLSDGADQLQDGLGGLADGADQLSAGADQLSSGLGQLSQLAGTAVQQLGQVDTESLEQVQQQVEQLVGVLQRVQAACASEPALESLPEVCAAADEGLQQLAAVQQLGGVQQLVDGLPALVGAVDAAASGADRLSDGADRLATGAHRLSDGAGRLSDGADRLAGGARQLQSGAEQARDGAARLSSGADSLAAGAGQLAVGADRLAGGAGKLADGLEEGAAQIPVVDDPKAAAAVIADPVDSSADTLNPVLDGETLLTPAMLALALWVGAFVIYLIRSGLPLHRLRAAVSPLRLAWSGWWPALVIGVVQAVLLLGAVLAFGAELARPVGVVAVVLLTVAVFTAINQALVTWLGTPRGWIVSIGFAAAQLVSLGGLLPIDTAPALVEALNAVMPIARASDALSQLTLGGATGNVATDVLVLLVWGAVAAALTVVSALRRQGLDLADLRREVSPA